MRLTESRDPALLDALRGAHRARPAGAGGDGAVAGRGVEGHAYPAYAVLARAAGVSDSTARAAWERGEREMVIAAALGERR